MAISKSFEELFVKPEDMSEQWENTAHELGRGKNRKELEKFLRTANEIYLPEYSIYKAISLFTKKNTQGEEDKAFVSLLKEYNEDIIDINVIGPVVRIETTKGAIKVRKLTDAIPALKADKDIETTARCGQCHMKSMEIATLLDMPNEVVTGYVYGLSDKSKYIHSWIEFILDNREFVIDYTLNALMNKEGFYQIRHAEPLNRITNKDIINDEKIINKFAQLKQVNIKEYLVFRDEIINDLKKNNQMFENER